MVVFSRTPIPIPMIPVRRWSSWSRWSRRSIFFANSDPGDSGGLFFFANSDPDGRFFFPANTDPGDPDDHDDHFKSFFLTKILVIPIIPMITLKVFFADFDPGDPDDPEDHFKSFFSLVPVILITLKLPVVIFSTIIQPCSQLLLQWLNFFPKPPEQTY